ncbi:MAG: response regulator [bacterium]|nr:response regulator [bacterium]
MKAIIVDDEPLALAALYQALLEAVPDAQIFSFTGVREAMDFARRNAPDVAFIDVMMPEEGGLSLGRALTSLYPRANVIFVTGYKEFAFEAIAMHASGYLMKPVTADDIRREMAFLRNAVNSAAARICVKTFGGFEILVDGKPVHFSRSLTLETLAYLVNKRGLSATSSELVAVLYGDRGCTDSVKNQFRNIVADIRKTLTQVHAAEMFVRYSNFLSVDVARFQCDYYDFLDGKPDAVRAYASNYMPRYTWAEPTLALLNSLQAQFTRVWDG